LTWYDEPVVADAVRRRRAAALIALAAMIGIGTTGTRAQQRATRVRTLSMIATAYCEGGETRSGTQAKSGTVAADRRVLPLGTTIRVVGLKARRPQASPERDRTDRRRPGFLPPRAGYVAMRRPPRPR
jgi:3D (Asp-Asp-Asp) domain-containing protein